MAIAAEIVSHGLNLRKCAEVIQPQSEEVEKCEKTYKNVCLRTFCAKW